MFNDKLSSFFRHALSGLGGALLYVGVDQAAAQGLVNALVPVVGGIASWGIAQALSLAKKKLR